jgi:ATP-dependent protease ClpP protease subunit
MKKYDLYLTGTVGWEISAGYVKYVLNEKAGKPVSVAICSLGGYVDTGLQIYELFKNHGDVNVEFLGMSASSATFMAMGAKTVKMAKNALILIHNSATWIDEWGYANKEQLDAIIARLKFQRDQQSTIDDVLAQIYAERNGKPVEDVKAKMKVAAWIKASDALDFGLVDEIIEAEQTGNAASSKTTNSLINDMGLPPLPSGFDTETGEDTPATGIIQKAVDVLSDLLRSLSAKKKSINMIKTFVAVMALLKIADGFQANEKGDISLTQDQMKAIDDELKKQDDACKKAKTVIDTLKEEIKTLKASIEQKDTEINNLKQGPGENSNGGEQVDDANGLTGAAELFNSIKDAL